jgi:hypothetical protein
MHAKFVRAGWAVAILGVAWHPTASQAFAAAISYPEYVIDANYTYLGEDPFAGGEIFVDLSNDSIHSANIGLSNPSLDFTNILSQGPDGSISGAYDVLLEDTTDTYDLHLVLDDDAALFAGGNGATVDPATVLDLIAGDVPESSGFTGTVDVPAPAALPVFATALTMLGAFGRRRKRPAVAA